MIDPDDLSKLPEELAAVIRDPSLAASVEPRLSLNDLVLPKKLQPPPKPEGVPVGALGKQVAEIVTMTQRGTLYVPKIASPPREVPKLQMEAVASNGPVAWLLGYMSPRSRAAAAAAATTSGAASARAGGGGSRSARLPPSNPLAGILPTAHVQTARGYEWIGDKSDEALARTNRQQQHEQQQQYQQQHHQQQLRQPPPAPAAEPLLLRRGAGGAPGGGPGMHAAAAGGVAGQASSGQAPSMAELVAARAQLGSQPVHTPPVHTPPVHTPVHTPAHGADPTPLARSSPPAAATGSSPTGGSPPPTGGSALPSGEGAGAEIPGAVPPSASPHQRPGDEKEGAPLLERVHVTFFFANRHGSIALGTEIKQGNSVVRPFRDTDFILASG